MNKSHIQHTVGLIQYKIIEIFQADKSLVDQIKQTSGGCDQYIYATFERIGLRLLSYTTEYNGMPHTGIFTVCRKTFSDLDSQFAGWCQYQCFDTTHFTMLAFVIQILNNRNGKCSRFTCSGLCTT